MKVFSKEHRAKISQALKGRKHSEKQNREHSKNMTGENNPNFGLKRLPETRKKISQALVGIKREPWSKERKEKASVRMKGSNNPFYGKKHSAETSFKISKAITGKLKGIKHSKEHRMKVGMAKMGSKNPMWQGGISFEPYTKSWTQELKEIVRKRDSYLCAVCKLGGKDVHHVDYDKKNCDPSNLITLCRRCHMKTNYNRDKWLEYFLYEPTRPARFSAIQAP